MSEPIPFRVTRYRCPHCPRTASSKARTVEHIARCWRNPEARGCKTCKHFDSTWLTIGDDCSAGIDLSGRPACTACDGTGRVYLDELDLGSSPCTACGGNGAEIKPGPIVGCDRWEAADVAS